MFTLKKEKIVDHKIKEIVERNLTDELIEEYFLYGEDQTCLPKYFDDCASDIENFEIRNDDIIVASFPRSGTTWTQEMVWLIKNKLDYKAAEVPLSQRFPMLESAAIYNPKNEIKELMGDYIVDSINYTRKKESPRFIKTHLPFSLLPKQIKDNSKTPKIIYVMRNPKDVFVSYFHMGNAILGWRIDKENFTTAFLADKVLYSPFWKNVLGFYEMRHLPNVLVIKYEDMHRDLKSIIRNVCVFLEEPPLTDEQLNKLCEHLSFKSMQKNNAVNQQHLLKGRKTKEIFIRSGQVGEYKKAISSEILDKIDNWIKTNIDGTDFDEKYAYSA